MILKIRSIMKEYLAYNLTLLVHIIIYNTLTALKASPSGEHAVGFTSFVCSGSSGFGRELATEGLTFFRVTSTPLKEC